MAEENPEDSVDITISNVVSHFSVRCHLNLRTIATNGSNVVYQREQSVSVLCLSLSVCAVWCFVLFLNVPVSRIFGDAPGPQTISSNCFYYPQIILMKLRTPQVTASIWSSGKIVCTGAPSEEQAKSASRRVARVLQRMGFRVKFSSYRVVNVLGTCRMPFGIKIGEFSTEHRRVARYVFCLRSLCVPLVREASEIFLCLHKQVDLFKTN